MEVSLEKWAREILARKAYEAYHRYLDEMVGKSGMGETIPFDELSEEVRHAWQDVVCEILCSYPLDLTEIERKDCSCRG
jgi:hypothetical protein